jgi:Predicted membrane protein
MDKNKFMAELSSQLSRIDAQERAEAIAFYNEYFEEAGIENEQMVIEELGSPTQVAAQIKADAAVKEIRTDSSPVKKGIALWTVILGICALPVAFPLLIVAMAAVFTILVLAATIVFTAAVIVGTVFVVGISLGAAGFSVLFAYPAIGIFYIGVGLALVGVSLLSAVFFILITHAAINGIIKLINYIRVKVQKKQAKKSKATIGVESDE